MDAFIETLRKEVAETRRSRSIIKENYTNCQKKYRQILEKAKISMCLNKTAAACKSRGSDRTDMSKLCSSLPPLKSKRNNSGLAKTT